MAGAYGPPPELAQPLPRHDAVLRRVAGARGDDRAVMLEGVHALKHAIRFGANIQLAVTPDRERVQALLAELAPDVALPPGSIVEVTAGQWQALCPRELPSPVVAVAQRPAVTPADVLAAPGCVVAVEAPRHLGNLGAVIRVAAAAEAGGVLVLGEVDPWHPTVVRAAAGLVFALPVARADDLPPTRRPLVALDPDGEPIDTVAVPADGILLVGTERAGLSSRLRGRADLRVRLPMRPGVSSLNLATAVAAALYRR